MVDGSLESPCRVLVKCNLTSLLSLAVEALQGKTCQKSMPSGGDKSLGANISGKGSSHCQYIDTTRKAIDCATTLPLRVFI